MMTSAHTQHTVQWGAEGYGVRSKIALCLLQGVGLFYFAFGFGSSCHIQHGLVSFVYHVFFFFLNFSFFLEHIHPDLALVPLHTVSLIFGSD